jgi:hypothetical protein
VYHVPDQPPALLTFFAVVLRIAANDKEIGMRLSLLLAQQGGALDGAIQGAIRGAIIGAIVGALIWVGLRLSQLGQKRDSGKDHLTDSPEEKEKK